MANAYNETGSGIGLGLVKTAYDRLLEFELRSQPQLRSIADKKVAQQTQPGSSVVFQLYNDLAPVTAALSEMVDPDAVALPATDSVTVTLAEYGNVSLTTRKLELFSMSDVDPAVANILAYNQADSLDGIVQTEIRGGTKVLRESGGALSTTAAATTITATDTIKSRGVRFAVAKLRSANVVPRRGSLYWAGIHPEVSHDLRAETGAAAWRDPHNYSAPDALWAGEIGVYEGAYFVESPRNYNAQTGSGTGATQVRVFNTYFAGMQALAEAVAEEPHTVIGPVTDKLMRFRPIGWYGVLGWKRYRADALWRLETASSINPNA